MDWWFKTGDYAPEIESHHPTKLAGSNGQKALSASPELITVLRSGWSSDYGALYRSQPAVRTVVDFLSRNIAQLNPKVYSRVANNDRVELDDHALANLLRQPNLETTRYTHLRDTVADLAIYDRAYWLKLGSPRPKLLARIPASGMNRRVDPESGKTIYKYGDQEYSRDKLVIFAGYSPEGNEDGVSPLETLRRTLAEEHASTAFRESFWRNHARPSGWIERPLEAPELSSPALTRLREDLNALYSGRENAGKIGLLEEGMTFKDAGYSARDSEYIEGRKLTYEEVARVYGVPASLLGAGGGESRANIESFHRQLYQDTFGPWLKFIQLEIELQLLPDFESTNERNRIYVEFNIAEKLKGSFEEQGSTLVSAVGVPYMTPNEARARLNLPRIDDDSFDLPIQPLNVMYGGQPAVNVPTETPGSPEVPKSRGVKEASPGALRRRDDAANAHETLLKLEFERQRRAVVSEMGKSKCNNRKATVDDLWRADRWNRELTQKFYDLAARVAGDAGRRAAEQIRGQYNPGQTLNYLFENSQIAAESINDHTRQSIADALRDDTDPMSAFDDAAPRAAALGMGRATGLINFARQEAGKQSSTPERERTKTWVVTSQRSRHPEMNGQTVKVTDKFSNGLLWPGDPAGTVEQVASCQCLLNLL